MSIDHSNSFVSLPTFFPNSLSFQWQQGKGKLKFNPQALECALANLFCQKDQTSVQVRPHWHLDELTQEERLIVLTTEKCSCLNIKVEGQEGDWQVHIYLLPQRLQEEGIREQQNEYRETLNSLNQQLIQKGSVLFNRYVDWWKREPEKVESIFWRAIESSMGYKPNVKAASSAITVLNHLRISFSRKILPEIQVDHADLLGANFEKANLKRASLAYTNLTDVCFLGANLSGVNFEGTQFGREPNLEHDEAVDCFVITPDERYLITSLIRPQLGDVFTIGISIWSLEDYVLVTKIDFREHGLGPPLAMHTFALDDELVILVLHQGRFELEDKSYIFSLWKIPSGEKVYCFHLSFFFLFNLEQARLLMQTNHLLVVDTCQLLDWQRDILSSMQLNHLLLENTPHQRLDCQEVTLSSLTEENFLKMIQTMPQQDIEDMFRKIESMPQPVTLSSMRTNYLLVADAYQLFLWQIERCPLKKIKFVLKFHFHNPDITFEAIDVSPHLAKGFASYDISEKDSKSARLVIRSLEGREICQAKIVCDRAEIEARDLFPNIESVKLRFSLDGQHLFLIQMSKVTQLDSNNLQQQRILWQSEKYFINYFHELTTEKFGPCFGYVTDGGRFYMRQLKTAQKICGIQVAPAYSVDVSGGVMGISPQSRRIFFTAPIYIHDQRCFKSHTIIWKIEDLLRRGIVKNYTVNSIYFSSDGQNVFILAGASKKRMQIDHYTSYGRKIETQRLNNKMPTPCTISCDKFLAIEFKQDTDSEQTMQHVSLWDIKTNAECGHQTWLKRPGFSTICLSPDAKQAAFINFDKRQPSNSAITIWHLPTNQLEHFSLDNYFSASQLQELLLAPKKESILSLSHASTDYSYLAIARGTALALMEIQEKDGNIQLNLKNFLSLQEPCRQLKFANNREEKPLLYLLYNTARTICYWDIQHECMQEISPPLIDTENILHFTVSSSSSFLSWVSNLNVLTVWNLNTKEPIHSFISHRDCRCEMEFSVDERKLAISLFFVGFFQNIEKTTHLIYECLPTSLRLLWMYPSSLVCQQAKIRGAKLSFADKKLLCQLGAIE